jgi:hypothetical protein
MDIKNGKIQKSKLTLKIKEEKLDRERKGNLKLECG